jgi:hypothetical protein
VKSANRQVGKWQRLVIGDWRLANGEQRVANSEFSGGQCSRTAENFRRIRRCALQRCRKFSAHQNGSEWRIAISDWRIMKRQIFWKAAFLHCRLCLTIAPCAYNSAPLHTCTPARLHDRVMTKPKNLWQAFCGCRILTEAMGDLKCLSTTCQSTVSA